jgi:hypothetical protein
MFVIVAVLCFISAHSFILNNNFLYYKNIINLPEIGSLHMISGGVWSLRKTPLKYRNKFLEMIPKRNILNFYNNSNNQDNSTGICEVKLPPNKPKPIRPIGPSIRKSLSFNEDEKNVKKVYLIEKINSFV